MDSMYHRAKNQPQELPRQNRPRQSPPSRSEEMVNQVDATNLFEANAAVESALQRGKDLVIIGIGNEGRFEASLRERPKRFNALILTPTNRSGLTAMGEIGDLSQRSKMRIVPMLGKPPYSASNPAKSAINARNSANGAIVIATPRALCKSFFTTDQGPKWLALVDRLIIYNLHFMDDVGGLPFLQRVLSFLPSQWRRQTILMADKNPYVNERVGKLIPLILRPNALYLNWPLDYVLPKSRAPSVPQRYAVTSLGNLVPALYAFLSQVEKIPNYKVVVFLQTTKLAQLYAGIFRALDFPVEELHSKRSGDSQTRALVALAESDELVMFTSDLTAQRSQEMRITHVVSVGVPMDSNQYARRVGIAAPGIGSSILFVTDYEKDAALKSTGKFRPSIIEATCYSNPSSEITGKFRRALPHVPWQLFANGFMSFIAVHATARRRYGWVMEDVVELAFEWSKYTTTQEAWDVTTRFADTFKLWRTEGITIDEGLNFKLSITKNIGMLNVDKSLEGRIPENVGRRGKNAHGRRLKPKKLRIGDWRDIMKFVKQDEMETLSKLNRKSPEGRKYLKLISQKAIQRSLTPNPREGAKLKEEKKNKTRPKKKRIRLSAHSWAPKFEGEEG